MIGEVSGLDVRLSNAAVGNVGAFLEEDGAEEAASNVRIAVTGLNAAIFVCLLSPSSPGRFNEHKLARIPIREH